MGLGVGVSPTSKAHALGRECCSKYPKRIFRTIACHYYTEFGIKTASNSGVATLRNFCWAAGPQKCLLGSLPKPGSLGQNVPKRLAASPPLSRLFLIVPPIRQSEQMVDVGLDRHGLPHIPLGLPILGIEGLFLIRQLPPLFFQRVHFGELFTA